MIGENILLDKGITTNEDLNHHFGGIYSRSEFEELQESAILMDEWAKQCCSRKHVCGMEEWAKDEGPVEAQEDFSCDWYHGTWQYMRLLNTVAVPRWYDFYHDTLTDLLRKNPHAHVMISACADYGMLHALDVSMRDADANPTIVIYDICNTPLKSSQWYAERHNLDIKCYCENIISANIETSSFDIVVTDEFLTVLKGPYKPLIVEKWKKILKPGGAVVTTAMVGQPTTLELRERYEQKALERFKTYGRILFPWHFDSEEKKQALLGQFNSFAMFHTRHMIENEEELKRLFRGYESLSIDRLSTPGECVNPTDSYQIVATV